MLIHFLAAIVLILVLLSAWCAVQHCARNYAHRHPQLGPAREEGGGCALECQCSNPDDEAHCRHNNACEQ